MSTMKAILVLVLAATAFASKTAVQEQILSMLQTGTKASDAIQSVYELLNDLTASNEAAQDTADEQLEASEAISESAISGFTEILGINQALLSQAVESKEYFQDEYQQAETYIAWNEGRTLEITRKSEELQENQCFSNQLFIRSLKTASEALEVISLLKGDLVGYIANGPTSVELAQTKATSVVDKLKQYSNIFNNNEINTFLQLAESSESSSEDSSADVELESLPTSGKAYRGTLPEQVLQLLADLEVRVRASMQSFKQNEIDASFQLAAWIGSFEAEQSFLAIELTRRELFADRTSTQISAAIAMQAKVSAILQESQDALASAISDIENKREAHADEKSVRDEQNVILDQVRTIFKEQVMSYSRRS